MTSANRSKQQLEQSYSKLSEQYNTLLQKNQNDLIKIKQKQKTFNQTIQQLKQQRQEVQKKYKNDINVLMLELEKMKNGINSNKQKQNNKPVTKQAQQFTNGMKVQLQAARKESKLMKQIVDQKNQRIQHLEQNARKLIDQNISLTSTYEQSKKQTISLNNKIKQLTQQNKELLKKVKQLTEQKQASKALKKQNQTTQTDGQFISSKEHTALIDKFNNQIKQLNKQIEVKQENLSQIKNRLKETNDQLKRFMDRDKRNNVLLKKKTQELENLQQQIQNTRKTNKTERKRVATEQGCAKCKQWQQQNKLLKQMVKSMQTMVRVREMEAERYKNREALNNSKVHEKYEPTQPKKSRGELPPLGKKN